MKLSRMGHPVFFGCRPTEPTRDDEAVTGGAPGVAGVNATNPKDSGVFSFPDGKRLEKVVMPFVKVRSVSANDGSTYVVSDGIKNFELGLADLAAGHFVIGSQTDALDVWNGHAAGQSTDGAVIFFKLQDNKVIGGAKLAGGTPLDSNFCLY